MGSNNIGVLTDRTEGVAVRVIAEPTGGWGKAGPGAPVANTPSELTRDFT